MDIKKLVSGVKKPWYVPAFLWNLAVDKIAGFVAEHAKVSSLSAVVSDKVMTALVSATHSCERRELVCRVVSGLGSAAAAASDAIFDGVVTDDESHRVGESVRTLLELAVDQETIDRTIRDVREGLKA